MNWRWRRRRGDLSRCLRCLRLFSELERAKQSESELQKRLQSGQAARQDIEERYNTLQEEVNVKTKRLKRVYTAYVQAKGELDDIDSEHQREMEVKDESCNAKKFRSTNRKQKFAYSRVYSRIFGIYKKSSNST